MKNHFLQDWAPPLAIVILILTTMACGISVSPDEIQVFTAGSSSTTAFTPTPALIPTATLPPLPSPSATANTNAPVIEAAAVDNVPPEPTQPPARHAPPDNFQSVSIISFVDPNTVEVMIDGVPYVLPYATLPPPPPVVVIQPTTTPPQWDTRLSNLGVTLTQAQPGRGETVFRLVNAQFLDERQANGLHHIYVEVVDEAGQRILGQPVAQRWLGGQVTGYTENKPTPEFALNFPIYGAQGQNNYEIFVEGAPSDIVSGLGLPGSRLVAYQLTFQRQRN